MSIFNLLNKEEKIRQRFNLQLTKSERVWIHERAVEECISDNSLVRRSIKLYKETVEKKQ